MKVTVDLKLLGRRIKEARHRRKLTQAKVGEEIGVSDSYISRIETGKARMSMYRFFTMATLLQVEPSDLLVGCCPILNRIAPHRRIHQKRRICAN